MLIWRILLGVLFTTALAALAWFDAVSSTPGVWLLPLAILIALAGTQELSRMFAARLPRPLGPVVYLGNAAIVAASGLSQYFTVLGGDAALLTVACAIVVVLTVEVFKYRAPDHHSEMLGAAAFALLYIGVLLSFAVKLRFCGPHGAHGIAALASLLLVVKFCDIGAYTVGRLVGRHKLAPLLSPGKTIEGACGGIAFAVVAAYVALSVLLPRLGGETAPQIPLWQVAAFGLSVGAAGMIGDLAESLVKRDLGRKDSSDWMPGFGGVLDLLDSILLGAPIAYLWWHYVFVGS